MGLRRPILAGNWKMYKTVAEATDFARKLTEKPAVEGVEQVICVPFTAISAVRDVLQGTGYGLGAQNMHHADEGAYTGEISPLMLKELGVTYVIIGHSERRQYFAETDETVNQKVKAALAHGLRPIICVGESLEEYEANQTLEVVRRQTTAALAGVSAEAAEQLVIAYEPIWAIGTGKSSTAESANETIRSIRQVVGEVLGQQAAEAIRIQYGGSVKPDNITSFMQQSDIDGALVGGASLQVDSFAALAAGVTGIGR